MTLRIAGGLAALTCAATYLIGFALLVTVLAPLGYGTGDVDPAAVTGFISERAGLLIAWNTMIYVVNALALLVLVVALHRTLGRVLPDAAAITGALGLVWSTLVLGAGMIANVAIERTHTMAATDPEGAARLWETLHAVEQGLGGGNEIAGGAWILVVSLAALQGRVVGRLVGALGLLSGLAGVVTILPPLGNTAGAIFGLGAIAWFLAIGVHLLRPAPQAPLTEAAT